jgi:hypothetical protein
VARVQFPVTELFFLAASVAKEFDEDGIRTHAGRAHWISSPTP